MYCYKCGTQVNNPEARFCPSCGCDMGSVLVEKIKTKHHYLKTIIISLVVVCLAVLGTFAGCKIKDHLEVKRYTEVGETIYVADSKLTQTEAEIWREFRERGFGEDGLVVWVYFDVYGNGYGERNYDISDSYITDYQKISQFSDQKHPYYLHYSYTEDNTSETGFLRWKIIATPMGWYAYYDNTDKTYTEDSGQLPSDIDTKAIFDKDTWLHYASDKNNYEVKSTKEYHPILVDEINLETLSKFKIEDLTIE